MLTRSPQVPQPRQKPVQRAETPLGAVQALLRVEKLPHRVWEPAAGRGAMVQVLRDAGHAVIASDICDYGFPLHFVDDFLMQTKVPTGTRMIITNPPNYLMRREAPFVAHALDLCSRVIILARLTFLEAEARTELLEHRGLARFYVFRDRVDMMHRDNWDGPKTSNPTAYAWFVFDRDHRGPATMHRVFFDETKATGNGHTGQSSKLSKRKVTTK